MSSSIPLRRRLRPLALFALQAGLWVALTFAFTTMIDLAGWITWEEAFKYSAGTWLPWIVLAPMVFWLAKRFPFERGRLWRNIPIHLAGCIACALTALWVSVETAPSPFSGPPRSTLVGPPITAGRSPQGTGGTAIAGGPGAGITAGNGPGTSAVPERGGRAARGVFEQRIREMSEGGRGGPPPPEGGTGSGRMGGRGGFNPGGPGFGPGAGAGGPGGPGWGGGGFAFRRFTESVSILLRANLGVALYFMVLASAHLVGYYRRTQQRERQALALAAGLNRAKLDALRLQLQPHFLFNTLNAISTLVHRDANAADELIGDLSELLRISLRTSEHEVSLSRELELLDRYLAIEQTRLGARLTIVREIDPAGAGAMVPTFMLQPLAENAIRHGIEPRREGGTLTIRAAVEGGILRLVVADDGVGLKAVDRNTARRGIGLANSEERLRTLHGPAAQLELVSPEAGGVEVRIALPIRTTPAPVAATDAVIDTPSLAT